jgi:integrase
MARRVKNADLETREARRKLKARGKPYWQSIGKGLHVGYRKGKRGGAWCVRHYVGDQTYKVETIAIADDVEDANQVEVLDFWHAQSAARNMRFGTAPKITGYTVADALRDYLEYLEPKSSHRISRQRAEAYILPALASTVVNDLDEDDLRRWHRSIADQPARVRTRAGAKQQYKRASGDPEARRKRELSANIILNLLKAALNRAYTCRKKTGVTSDAPWKLVEPFKGVNVARTRYLSLDECRNLLDACDPGFRILVRAALETGARYGELARLRIADFNRDAGTLHIRKSQSGRERHVILSSGGSKFFAQLVRSRDDPTSLLLGKEWGITHQCEPMDRAVATAKIEPRATFHALRHTYASHAVMNGAPLWVVARNLGHADTRMVEKHYGHLAPSYVADAIRAAVPNFG